MGAARDDFALLPDSALPAMPRIADPALIAQPRPVAAAAPLQAGLPPAQPVPTPRVVFAADIAAGLDLLDHAALVRPLAELLAHSGTQTPLTIGLLGPPGSGKSHALGQLLQSVEAISAAAGKAAGAGPFLAPLFIVQIDAAQLSGEAEAAIADQVYASLARPGAQDFSALAEIAADMAGNPREIAQQAAEKLDAARRQLDSERRNQEELVARRARLTDTVLHELAGSPVDAYLRSRRSSIESRLRGFGFTTGDVTANFKDLVRDLADSGGSMPGFSAFLRATWAFAGQTRRIVWALIFLGLAFGIGQLQATKAVWLDMLLNAGPNLAPIAGWLTQHESWLGILKTAVLVVSSLLIASNLWRALRFTQPLIKGVALLRGDVEARGQELDALIAHQSSRLDSLAEEIAQQQRSASTSGKRALASGAAGKAAVRSLLASAAPPSQARKFLATLDSLLHPATPDAAKLRPASVPQRIIVAIDNLDTVAAARAFEIVDGATRALGGHSYAIVLALDPKTLGTGKPDESARLEKYVQVPAQIGRNGLNAAQGTTMVLNLLGHVAAQGRIAPPAVDASRSILDRSLTVAEAKLLSELAPLAGRSARAVKRFVNLFRLARAASPDHGAAIAFMLALDIGGTPAEIAALRNALGVMDANTTFNVPDGGVRVAGALQAVRMNSSNAVTGAVMLAGLNAASVYMRR